MVDKINPVYEEKKKKRSKVKIAVGIILAIFILVASFLFIFHLKEVTFSGNSYYSDEELTDMLLKEGLSGNSLYVMLKYNVFSKPEIPYIQGISVRMINPGHLQIEVSEKVIAGCVDYMGTYMYFDNEGYVRVWINSGGADSPRQIDLRKAKDEKWYLWEQYVLVGIRKPESQNPWA